MPSQAPTVSLGVTYFGDTSVPESQDYGWDFWRLPSLLAGDRVQVAWASDTDDWVDWGCLTGNTDDYDFSEKICNLAEDWGGDKQQRYGFKAKTAAQDAFLTFGNWDGAYHFVVERIQHRVGVALPAVSAVRHNGRIAVHPTLTNGHSLPGGLGFRLSIRVGGKTLERTAKTNAKGVVSFALAIPTSAIGQRASLQVTRGTTATYQRVKSPTIKATVR